MEQEAEGVATEKLSQGTIGARRWLQVVSLIGFLVAIVPLSADSVSVLGIGFSIGEDALKGILTVVLAYLTLAFAVRVFTDLAAAEPSRLDIRLRERIDGQTDDIAKRTVNQLANLLRSGPDNPFRSKNFESLLSDTAPRRPTYRGAMIKNTVSDIGQWVSRNPVAMGSQGAIRKDAVAQEFEPVLEELLASHEGSCRRRRLLNIPRWVLHRALIALRFTFFDALAPLMIALLVIALLCGWLDTAWFRDWLGVVTL